MELIFSDNCSNFLLGIAPLIAEWQSFSAFQRSLSAGTTALTAKNQWTFMTEAIPEQQTNYFPQTCAASSTDAEAVDISFDDRTVVASRRSLALLIDYAIVFAICATPGLYRIFAGVILETNNKVIQSFAHAAIHHGLAAAILFFLLATPIPIIYLRITFRTLLNRCTPGEHIAGVTTYAQGNSSNSWLQSSRSGFAQYLQAMLAFTIANLAVALFTPLDVQISPFYNYAAILLWETLSPILPLALFFIYFLSALLTLNFSFSRKDYRSLIDRKLGIAVNLLKNKPAIAISAEQTANFQVATTNANTAN